MSIFVPTVAQISDHLVKVSPEFAAFVAGGQAELDAVESTPPVDHAAAIADAQAALDAATAAATPASTPDANA